MISTRPYLIRAFYEWIVDNNLTPYILVDATCKNVDVPQDHVKDGQIVFNITMGIVEKLQLQNDAVTFEARFSGAKKNIYLPMVAILAIYARENGQGMAFDPNEIFEEDEGGGGDINEISAPSSQEKNSGSSQDKKPFLKIVK